MQWYIHTGVHEYKMKPRTVQHSSKWCSLMYRIRVEYYLIEHNFTWHDLVQYVAYCDRWCNVLSCLQYSTTNTCNYTCTSSSNIDSETQRQMHIQMQTQKTNYKNNCKQQNTKIYTNTNTHANRRAKNTNSKTQRHTQIQICMQIQIHIHMQPPPKTQKQIQTATQRHTRIQIHIRMQTQKPQKVNSLQYNTSQSLYVLHHAEHLPIELDENRSRCFGEVQAPTARLGWDVPWQKDRNDRETPRPGMSSRRHVLTLPCAPHVKIQGLEWTWTLSMQVAETFFHMEKKGRVLPAFSPRQMKSYFLLSSLYRTRRRKKDPT